MSNRQTLLFAAAVAFAMLGAAPLRAAETAPVHGAKTVGAMTLETLGRATNGTQTNRQSGFATAGAVQWIRTPAVQVSDTAQAF